MKLTNLTIKNLFIDDTKLTFLVGAGCSVDAPSCLPSGRAMMEAIIKYSCAESEIKKLLKLEESGELRFEALVEIIRNGLDPEVKLIDYYGQCDKPNLQHFFLAEMIKKGHFVMTTNFDFLIEYALLQSNVPKEEVIPVITKHDFEKYKDPNELLEEGKKTVYKIHGSTKNVINGENTKDSLVATIQAFGSNKEGLNMFQVEPFKRDLFNNISNGRSLIVMGYSGSDDFDVVPTLKVLENLRNIIWINYDDKSGAKEQIYEIEANESDTLDKVNQILGELKRANTADHIYRANANTSELIENLLEVKPETSSNNFSVSPKDWLKQYVKSPSQIIKYQIPHKIYNIFDMNEDAMRCLEKILLISQKTGDQFWKSLALNDIATIHYAQGNYPEALKKYEEALKIAEQLGDLSEKATRLNNIGIIYDAQGNYPEALKKYEEALKISEQLGDLSKMAGSLNNIGEIYRVKGNYPEALKSYEEALKISEQLGDLFRIATRLNNIGMIYNAQGNYPEALKRYKEALKIDEQLGDLSGKANRLNNIGTVHYAQGNYPEALKRYEEALNVNERLGDLSGKATNLNNIGALYKKQGNYPEALKRYERALNIAKQLGNLSGKATNLNNIGMIYYAQGNYSEALKYFEEALQILIELRLSDSPNAKAIKRNIEYAKSKMK
ncbi:MAG: tetratricopeptide repeat protein [Promethearchaeota archaeon]